MAEPTNNPNFGGMTSNCNRPEEVLGEITTGRLLRGARYREGLTQQALADMVGCKKHHISEMEHDKRGIGKKMAKRLAEALNVDYRFLFAPHEFPGTR